jgi:hypothetical protein
MTSNDWKEELERALSWTEHSAGYDCARARAGIAELERRLNEANDRIAELSEELNEKAERHEG